MFKFKKGDICIVQNISYPPNVRYNGTECTVIGIETSVPSYPYWIETEDRKRYHAKEYELRLKPGQRGDLDTLTVLDDDNIRDLFVKLIETEEA